MHFDIDNIRMERPLPIAELQVQDIGLVGAKDIGDGGQCARFVLQDDAKPRRAACGIAVPTQVHPVRSEEHTSELQSLMRISYAVFCLKKKKNKHIMTYTTSTAHTPLITLNQ